MENAYVENGVLAENASTTVGAEVIKAVAQKYQTNNQIGKATIEIDGFGTVENVVDDATIIVYTTDFEVEGTIYKDGGRLIWGEIEKNKPRIVGVPTQLELTIASFPYTINATVKGTDNSISWESDAPTIVSVSNGVLTVDETKVTNTTIVTISASADGCETKTCVISIKKPVSIGDNVNYSTILNGQTLNNWSVFYIDGDYTYIILDNYLTRVAVSDSIKSNYNLANGKGTTFATIKSTTNRTDLINAMTTTSNWTDLINNGSMNGTALTSAVKSDTNVKAMGAPDIELWCNSWNSASNGFSITITPSQNVTGYQLNSANTLTIPSGDKRKANYPLYFPHTSAVDSCDGYWLASPSAVDTNCVVYVSFNGYVDFYGYSGTNSAFRPVVCLPSSIF